MATLFDNKTTSDFSAIKRWYSGKALSVVVDFVLPTLAVAEEQGYWPKGTSRKVWAALNKQNIAIKWARAHEKEIEEIRMIDGVRGLCTNCGQWQRDANGGDCVNECAKRGLATATTAEEAPYRKSAWLIAHAMRFGLVAEAPAVLDIGLNLASNLKLGATDQVKAQRELLQQALAWAAHFTPVAQLLKHLDATRPKPVVVLGSLSRTVVGNVGKAMGVALDSIASPPIEWTWVTRIDPKTKQEFRVAVGKILWPEGTRHNVSKFAYGSKAGNMQCHACGHAIHDGFNWVPLMGGTNDGVSGVISLWVGRDCARKLFAVDVTGDAEYSNRTEGK